MGLTMWSLLVTLMRDQILIGGDLREKGASELERVGIKLMQEGVAIKRSRETEWHLEVNTDV